MGLCVLVRRWRVETQLKGLSLWWIATTDVPLTLCFLSSVCGICAYQITLHKSTILIGSDIKGPLTEFQPSGKKETKHVKMIQQRWSQWVSSLLCSKKEVLSTYHRHLGITVVFYRWEYPLTTYAGEGGGGLAKCLCYYISLCSKLAYGGGGVKNCKNLAYVV